jgi:hypothetical protein
MKKKPAEKDQKKKPYLIRFDPELLEILKKEAAEQRRPFNGYVEYLLWTYVTKEKVKK